MAELLKRLTKKTSESTNKLLAKKPDEDFIPYVGHYDPNTIITKNGESYVALIDSDRLDYYHQLERERIHLLLINEAGKGLDDIAAGRSKDARSALQAIKRKRAATGG